jgi:hypothetical protein
MTPGLTEHWMSWADPGKRCHGLTLVNDEAPVADLPVLVACPENEPGKQTTRENESGPVSDRAASGWCPR